MRTDTVVGTNLLLIPVKCTGVSVCYFSFSKEFVRCLIFRHVMKQTVQEALECSSDKCAQSGGQLRKPCWLKEIRWLTLGKGVTISAAQTKVPVSMMLSSDTFILNIELIK